MDDKEYRRCLGCGVLIDVAFVFCGDECEEQKMTGHDCVFDPDGICMVIVDGKPCGRSRFTLDELAGLMRIKTALLQGAARYVEDVTK